MGKFKTLCGQEFDVLKNDTHATGVYIAREYPEDMKECSYDLDEQCKNCPAQKSKFKGEYYSKSNDKLYSVNNTICIAKNIHFKEYDLVNNYEEPCSNTREEYVFEITLQEESGIRYLYYKAPSSNMSAYDHIEDLIENIWEERFEDKVDKNDVAIIQFFDNKCGDVYNVELYDIEDLKKYVTGIRLVKFNQTIVE